MPYNRARLWHGRVRRRNGLYRAVEPRQPREWSVYDGRRHGVYRSLVPGITRVWPDSVAQRRLDPVHGVALVEPTQGLRVQHPCGRPQARALQVPPYRHLCARHPATPVAQATRSSFAMGATAARSNASTRSPFLPIAKTPLSRRRRSTADPGLASHCLVGSLRGPAVPTTISTGPLTRTAKHGPNSPFTLKGA